MLWNISLSTHFVMPTKKTLSLKEVRGLPPATLLRLINKAKKELKKDKTMLSICKDHDADIEDIDYIPTYFKTLDVSAKTDKGVVWLNYKLLCDGDFEKDYSYLIHEYTHWFQQCYGKEATQSSDDGDYLSNPYEEEGFANQVEYIADHEGEDVAENYVEGLLDHHDVEDKKERQEKKEVFMAKV